ncbi:MAG TPA: hypothetical protein VEI74_11425 [Candidatus Methylomirabilis sp.]|nr:hypothetical protein [Candidatus Methylomirabilis sp.]
MAQEGGYSYYVSDEQLEAYARLSPLERLKWFDEMRLFTLMASTPEIAERRERLRRGEPIVDVSQEKEP